MGLLGGAKPYPGHGWAGLGAMGGGAALAQLDAPWAPTIASILAWWGLAVALDGAAGRRRGRSLLRDAPDAAVWMAVLSIFLGVAVEWAAGRLGVWSYLRLPFNEFVRYAVQGAVFAAFLPALHGLAALLGAAVTVKTGKPAVAKGTRLAAAAAGAALLAASLWPLEHFSSLVAFALAFLGLWLSADSLLALRNRPSLLDEKGGQLARWAVAGLALVGVSWLITAVAGQGRYPAGFESPAALHYALLAFLGPALRASYLLLADSLGLPAWPGREEYHALIR